MHAIEQFDEASNRDLHDAPAPARILVVDSDADLRNVLTGCLLELGYSVSCVADGREAVRLVANGLCEGRAFGAVILDLAERDGAQSIEAFETMRRLDPDIAVIATSTWPHSAWLVDYDSFGFAAALPKPWRFVELAMALKRVLEPPDERFQSSIRIKI
jgi:two-component system cell cycle sensor histidine kinase/response regulator CckA